MDIDALLAHVLIQLAVIIGFARLGGIDKLTFALFIALTLSITALPILGRILIEFGLNRAPRTSLAHIPELAQRRPEQARPVASALT